MSYKLTLSNEILLKKAPSIFATTPINGVSSRYAFIPTIKVVDVFRDNGWYPVEVRENKVRIDDKKGYQKHLIRFRHFDYLLTKEDDIPEIILTNSHDKTSSFVIKLGVFRFVCENGLVVASSMFESFNIRHIGYNAFRVEEAIAKIVAYLPELIQKIKLYKSINLSPAEQLSFAKAAKEIRFEQHQEIDLSSMLKVRREGDYGDDLWRVFNRIEESCIRGGIKGKNTLTGRNFTSKPVTNIDKQLKINENLFELTHKIANIKLSA
jgi:hypothetical protein